MRAWQRHQSNPLWVAVLGIVWACLAFALLFPDSRTRSEASLFAYQRYADATVLVDLVREEYPAALSRWLRFDGRGFLREARLVFDLASRRGSFPSAAASHWALLFHRLGDPERARAALALGDAGEEGPRERVLRLVIEGEPPDAGDLRLLRDRYLGGESQQPDWVLLAGPGGDPYLGGWLAARGRAIVRRGLLADAIGIASVLAALAAAFWLLSRRGRLPAKPRNPRLPGSWGGWRFAQEFLLAECIAILGATAVSLPLFLAGAYDLAVLVSGTVFMTAPLAWLAWRLTPGARAAAFLFLPELRAAPRGRAAPGIAFGLLGFAILAVVAVAAAATGFGADALADGIGVDGLDRTLAIVAGFFVAAVLAPVCEEFVFRGFLFGYLRSRWGAWPAALASSAVFAALHGYSGAGLLVVFLYGLVFAWLYHRSGSLLPGIVAHALFNFVLTCQLVGWYSLP